VAGNMAILLDEIGRREDATALREKYNVS
jgi:stage III sporulation protein SpoIIIAA